MIVFITSYNREKMLKQVVKAWLEAGAEVHVFDDGSDFKPLQNVYWHHHQHRGKRGFWHTWDEMLRLARTLPNEDGMVVFTQDDMLRPDIEAMQAQHKRLNKWAYAHNINNDGRTVCWNNIMPRVIDANLMEVGFVDCGFFCNNKALEAIGYYMQEVPQQWHQTHGSSGVGAQLSKRMLKRAVTMLLPTKSMAYHGSHDSKMHPTLRKKQPLISK